MDKDKKNSVQIKKNPGLVSIVYLVFIPGGFDLSNKALSIYIMYILTDYYNWQSTYKDITLRMESKCPNDENG